MKIRPSPKMKKEIFRIGLRAFPSKYRNGVRIYDYSPQRRMAVIGIDQWINYTRKIRHHANATALVIFDKDSKTWNSVRIPPDICNVRDALQSLVPAEVNHAIVKGKKIKRQGDIYFIPQKIWNLSELMGTNHAPWEITGRNSAMERLNYSRSWDSWALVKRIIVYHPHHKPLVLDSPHKAKQQVTALGRTHSMGD